MRIQLPSKRLVLCVIKILLGSAAAFAAVLTGKGTCPPNTFCMDLGFFMPMTPFSISMVVIAMALLISAFQDIYKRLNRIDIGARDIESIATRQNAEFYVRPGGSDE